MLGIPTLCGSRKKWRHRRKWRTAGHGVQVSGDAIWEFPKMRDPNIDPKYFSSYYTDPRTPNFGKPPYGSFPKFAVHAGVSL